MNEDDLRDCFAMFAMLGWCMNGDYTIQEIPSLSYTLADMMLEARSKTESDEGIATIKKRKYVRKS